MGKFISKISPTVNSGQLVESANSKVSRKVMYRRLQSPRPYEEKSTIGFFDFWHYYGGLGIVLLLVYVLERRGEFDGIALRKDLFKEDSRFELKKNLFQMTKERYLEQKEERNSIAKSDSVTESVNPEAKSEVSVHS